MIYDGIVNKKVYENNFDINNPLYLFSISSVAKAMLLPPYKEDVMGGFIQPLSNWYAEGYRMKLEQIAADYFYDVVQGEKDMDGTWEEYLDELYLNGLSEWLEIIERYPVVG